MTLGLDIVTKGRRAKVEAPISSRAVSAREVSEALTREEGIEAAPLGRIKAQHKRLAMAIAQGVPHGRAAMLNGFSVSRVSILMGDDTFRDLVERMRHDIDAGVMEEVLEIKKNSLNLAHDIIELITERVHESPDDVSTDEARKIFETVADRTGFGPKRTEEKNVNVNIGSRLEDARRRVEEARKQALDDNTIEGEIIKEAAE